MFGFSSSCLLLRNESLSVNYINWNGSSCSNAYKLSLTSIFVFFFLFCIFLYVLHFHFTEVCLIHYVFLQNGASKETGHSILNSVNKSAFQIKKPPHRRTSPLNWFPRKKTDSYLKRKIKLLQVHSYSSSLMCF